MFSVGKSIAASEPRINTDKLSTNLWLTTDRLSTNHFTKETLNDQVSHFTDNLALQVDHSI